MPGETPLDTSREPRPADDLDVIVEPAVLPIAKDPVTASDIDPLMGDTAPAPAGAPAAAATPARTATKRRWWQRIIEWDDASANGTASNGHAPADVGAEANVARWDADPVETAGTADAVDPLAGWAAEANGAAQVAESDAASRARSPEAPETAAPATDSVVMEPAPPTAPVAKRGRAPRGVKRGRAASVKPEPGAVAEPEPGATVEAEPEAASAVDAGTVEAEEIDEERWQWTPVPAVDLVPASEREAVAAEIDDRQPDDEGDEWNDWAVLPGTDGTGGSPAAWAVPLTDLPDGAEPDVGDAPELEPARTGEFPRVPMLAAERARLEPEPQPEPTWLQRRRAHRPRVRRVTRIVRRIDTWTVFKLSLLFWAVAYLILLVAGVLLWSVAISTGTVDNVESFIKDLLALDSFTFDGQKIFRASWVLGAFMAVAGTGLTVTMAVLYNLFADLVGGVRVTVLEEEVVQRPPSRRSV